MDEALLKAGQYPNVAILAGTDPKEVMREYSDDEHMDNGVSVHMCPNDTGAHSNVNKNSSDSREKLEAWAHEEIAEKWAQSDREATMIMNDLLDLLDRQAAITTAECTSEDESCCEACRAAQKREIAELTAELDACRMREKAAEDYDFRAAAERWEQAYEDKCGEVVRLTAEREQYRDNMLAQTRRVAELTAERDQLSRDLTAEHALVVQFEHDNEELKVERDELKAEITKYEHDCGLLFDEKHKLTAERDQLKADLKQARIEWESERDYADQCDERAHYTSRGWAKANMGWAEANAEAEQWRQKCNQLSRDLDAEHALVVQFECDNAKANDTINTLRASVAGLKDTVEKLKSHETA